MSKPFLVDGGSTIDDRGIVSFMNDPQFSAIKRFYVVENFSTDTVRAFHGHLKEEKYVYVVSGSALVVLSEIVQHGNDEPLLKDTHKFVLSAKRPQILYIPAGYANGFRCLEQDTKVMFFSTSTLEESKNDDFRFSYAFWGDQIWRTHSR